MKQSTAGVAIWSVNHDAKYYWLRWLVSVSSLASGLVGTFTLGYWNLEGFQLWSMKRFVEYAEPDNPLGESVMPPVKRVEDMRPPQTGAAH